MVGAQTDAALEGLRPVLESAIAPLRGQFEPAEWKRLVTALTVCVGIEAMLVLKDSHVMTPNQAIRVSQWAAVALVRQAVVEAQLRKPAKARTRKRDRKAMS